jgi:hypothetical protein
LTLGGRSHTLILNRGTRRGMATASCQATPPRLSPVAGRNGKSLVSRGADGTASAGREPPSSRPAATPGFPARRSSLRNRGGDGVNRVSTLYLLHIEPPYKHARHYLGIALDDNVSRRLHEHLVGRGSPLLEAAVAAGCVLHLVATFTGDKVLERRLKRNAHSPAWCPMCQTPPVAPGPALGKLLASRPSAGWRTLAAALRVRPVRQAASRRACRSTTTGRDRPGRRS